MKRLIAACAVTAAAGVGLACVANAAELPEPTKKMLKALKFDESILKGIDDELKLPDGWLEKARKEGVVQIYTTMRPEPWKRMHGIWKARYPGIKAAHSEVRGATRRYIRPLAAFKEGRHVVDVIMGLSGNVFLFRQAGAFADVSDVPNYSKIPDIVKQKDHIAVATRTRYWCMSYNTDKVKKSDLPKTWDDLVDGDRFANKKLMIGNRPNNWLLNLWEAQGDAWGKEFTRKLILKLKPQLRKEGMSALLNLVVLGEGDAAVPSAMNRVGPLAQKGAPIGHHCPEPVPYTISEMGLMANTPHPHAARIFINWFLSKEGQIAQFYANDSTPVHEELQGKEFIFWPENVQGKKLAVLGEDSAETSKRLIKFWNPLWQQGGGYVPPTPKTVSVKLDAVKRGGRRIEFKVDGKADTAKISRSRTKITIAGKKASRGSLKPGMSCKVHYPAGGGEAKSVACD